uniref:Protein kinase domain-containing protein n=1 Tax=Leersia perrieri TaxID=77586 RepID=A0A0D9VUZ7_9ORYZ
MAKASSGWFRAASGMVPLGFTAVAMLLLATSFLEVTADTSSDDVTALNAFYTTLNSPSQLTNWVVQNGDPCGQSWLGITCSGSRVITIKLPGMGLNGNLGYNMNILTALVELNLEKNSFTGTLPYSISQMATLKYLNLGHNQLSSINVMFNQLTNMTTLDLSDNTFSGTLPDSFSSMTSLTMLNVENNQLSGAIPDKLKGISNLHPATPSSPSPSSSPPSTTSQSPPRQPSTRNPGNNNKNPSIGSNGDSSSDSGGGGGSSSKIGSGAVAGIVISLVVLGAMVAFFVIKRKSMRGQRGGDPEKNEPLTLRPISSGKLNQLRTINIISPSAKEGLQKTVSMNLKPPSKIDLHRSFDESDPTNKTVMVKSIDLSSIRANVYTVADLQLATESFSADNLIGEGSFGRVYRAQISDDKVLAVKKINLSALPSNPSDFFIDLVANISKFNHPNLSELDGYCSEHGQYLLAYEFYRNGSLHDFLHLSDGYSNPLSWNNRVKIALGSARALEYMHETCSPSVIHKNFKSSNILLDNELNPHLSDCGFADLIPNQELQESDENSGYRAPEVTMSGQYTQKSDIYSFGVVMLELLTGRKAFDRSQPWPQQSLVRWATPQLHDIDALDQMVDPALEGLYPAKSLSRFADAIALCVQPEPEFRPPMSEVVQSLVRLVQRSSMGSVMSGESNSRRYDESGDYTF